MVNGGYGCSSRYACKVVIGALLEYRHGIGGKSISGIGFDVMLNVTTKVGGVNALL